MILNVGEHRVGTDTGNADHIWRAGRKKTGHGRTLNKVRAGIGCRGVEREPRHLGTSFGNNKKKRKNTPMGSRTEGLCEFFQPRDIFPYRGGDLFDRHRKPARSASPLSVQMLGVGNRDQRGACAKGRIRHRSLRSIRAGIVVRGDIERHGFRWSWIAGIFSPIFLWQIPTPSRLRPANEVVELGISIRGPRSVCRICPRALARGRFLGPGRKPDKEITCGTCVFLFLAHHRLPAAGPIFDPFLWQAREALLYAARREPAGCACSSVAQGFLEQFRGISTVNRNGFRWCESGTGSQLNQSTYRKITPQTRQNIGVS